MSVEAIAWAWKQQVVESATDRFVLLALANYASPDGERIFPSVARIQQMTGLGERTVQDARRRLLDAGLIVETGTTLKGCREFDMPGVREPHPSPAGAAPEPSVQPSDLGEQQKKESKLSKEVEEIWSHYVAVLDAKRQTLDSNRRSIIRNALKVRTLDECKRAIDGLRVSPFHNGDNEQKKKYLGIQYALKGRNGESHDERIDKMIVIADEHGGGLTGSVPANSRRVQILVEHVRYAWSNDAEKRRGREAYAALKEMGYDVKLLTNPRRVLLVNA